MPCFMVTNSAPKTGVSTVDCFFENHCMRAISTCIKEPLFDLQNTLSQAWSLSTHMWESTSLLRFWGVHEYSLLGILTELWWITVLKDCDLYLGTKDHTPVWNDISDQWGPWHVLLHIGAPPWGALHGMTIMKPLLLYQSFLTQSSIFGCQSWLDNKTCIWV